MLVAGRGASSYARSISGDSPIPECHLTEALRYLICWLSSSIPEVRNWSAFGNRLHPIEAFAVRYLVDTTVSHCIQTSKKSWILSLQ